MWRPVAKVEWTPSGYVWPVAKVEWTPSGYVKTNCKGRMNTQRLCMTSAKVEWTPTGYVKTSCKGRTNNQWLCITSCKGRMNTQWLCITSCKGKTNTQWLSKDEHLTAMQRAVPKVGWISHGYVKTSSKTRPNFLWLCKNRFQRKRKLHMAIIMFEM